MVHFGSIGGLLGEAVSCFQPSATTLPIVPGFVGDGRNIEIVSGPIDTIPGPFDRVIRVLSGPSESYTLRTRRGEVEVEKDAGGTISVMIPPEDAGDGFSFMAHASGNIFLNFTSRVAQFDIEQRSQLLRDKEGRRCYNNAMTVLASAGLLRTAAAMRPREEDRRWKAIVDSLGKGTSTAFQIASLLSQQLAAVGSTLRIDAVRGVRPRPPEILWTTQEHAIPLKEDGSLDEASGMRTGYGVRGQDEALLRSMTEEEKRMRSHFAETRVEETLLSAGFLVERARSPFDGAFRCWRITQQFVAAEGACALAPAIADLLMAAKKMRPGLF